MNYLPRALICERLRLGLRQSYRLVGSSYGERINSDEVIHLLNRARRGIVEPLAYIPSDLKTIEETAAHFKASLITERELKAWIHRTKNIPPHFYLNKNTIRFSLSRLEEWLKNRSRVRRCA